MRETLKDQCLFIKFLHRNDHLLFIASVIILNLQFCFNLLKTFPTKFVHFYFGSFSLLLCSLGGSDSTINQITCLDRTATRIAFSSSSLRTVSQRTVGRFCCH